MEREDRIVNFKLEKPDFLLESQRKQKGFNVFLEILLFIGLFFISQTATGLVTGIPLTCYILAGGGVTPTTDINALQAKINDIAMLLGLFTQIVSIFAILGLCRLIEKRKAWTLGFKKRHMLKEYGIGMLAGFLMMAVAVAAGLITGALKIRFNQEILQPKVFGIMVLYFFGFLIQGMNEEVLCRGYFLTSLARKKGNVWMGIIVSALVFAALPLGNPGIGVLSFCNLTLFGIFAGVYYIKRGDLWGIGALHSLWNFTQGNVFGVLVSGLRTPGSLFLADPVEKLNILNGGTFGLEGGLIVTVILVVGTLLLLKLPQKDVAAEEIVPAETAVPEPTAAE